MKIKSTTHTYLAIHNKSIKEALSYVIMFLMAMEI